MNQRFSLSVKSQVENLAGISDFVEMAARESGLDDHETYDVQMAVDEACTNVIKHAYHGRKDGTIEIECSLHGKEFTVVIKDQGDRFDPGQIPPPNIRHPLSRRNIGGLGLFFMNKLMDRVDFDFSSSGGNRLTMVKKIKR